MSESVHFVYLFSNFNLVSSRQNLQIWFESAGFENLIILLTVEGFTKENVVFQCSILYPCLLSYVCQFTLDIHQYLQI